MIPLDSNAPDFSLPDQDGEMRSLQDFRGKNIVLYFYPKDDTPGCTKEACNFRDSYHELQKKDVVILGVSKDTIASHKKFAEKYKLTFPLLSNPEKNIIKEYGAWGPKKFMGREFDGTLRISYLIDKKGIVIKSYPKVNPLLHAEEIIKDVESL